MRPRLEERKMKLAGAVIVAVLVAMLALPLIGALLRTAAMAVKLGTGLASVALMVAAVIFVAGLVRRLFHG